MLKLGVSVRYFDFNYNAVFCCHSLDQFYGRFQNFNKNMFFHAKTVFRTLYLKKFGVQILELQFTIFQPDPIINVCDKNSFNQSFGSNKVCTRPMVLQHIGLCFIFVLFFDLSNTLIDS